MINAEINLDEQVFEVSCEEPNSVTDLMLELLALNVAVARGIGQAVGVDEDRILDIIAKGLREKREEVRSMVFDDLKTKAAQNSDDENWGGNYRIDEKTGLFEYDDRLSFLFPDWIEVTKDVDEDGEEHPVLNIGLYIDDDGDIQHRVTASFARINIKKPDMTIQEVCEDLARATEGTKYYVVPGSPECMFMTMPMLTSTFGFKLKLRRYFFALRIDKERMVAVTGAVQVSEDNEHNIQFYRDMLEVARSVRIDGKPLQLERISEEQLMQAIEPTFNEDDEPVDITSSIKVQVSSGDETTTYSFGDFEPEDEETSSGWGQNITIQDDESDVEDDNHTSGIGWGGSIKINGEPL